MKKERGLFHQDSLVYKWPSKRSDDQDYWRKLAGIAIYWRSAPFQIMEKRIGILYKWEQVHNFLCGLQGIGQERWST